MAIAKIEVISSQFIESRSVELQKLGFSGYDATHIASPQRSRADIFLSTDDRLLRKAQKNMLAINVAVDNPVQWLMKSIQVEDNDND